MNGNQAPHGSNAAPGQVSMPNEAVAGQTPRQFATKTGFCFITDTTIEIRRQGVRGRLSQGLFGNNINRTRWIYLVCGVTLILFALILAAFARIYDSLLFGFFGLVCIYVTISSRRVSAATSIPRDRIESVEFYPPNPGVTRPYFVVCFRADNGRLLRRNIFLPGSMQLGFDGGAWAVLVMTAEGLLK